MAKTDQKTGRKSGKTSVIFGKPKGKERGPGKRFQKNDPTTGFIDERINRTGQNAKFTEVRRMMNRILDERLPKYQNGQIVMKKDGKTPEEGYSMLEAMLRDWIASRDYQKQAKALEIGIGKVPDELHVTGDMEEFVKQNMDIFTDGQLQRISTGENPLYILAELIRDNVKKNNKEPE